MAEDELRELLLEEGLEASSWNNGAFDRYSEHRHAYDKVLVVATGSITFHLSEFGQHILLDTGDRLNLPARTLHGADVGAAGVACLEAHRPAGTLDEEPEHLPDWGAIQS
jgi:uncharacterized protein YjlB